MIRRAQRPLANSYDGEALLKLGHTETGERAVSVDVRGRFAGNRSFTNPYVLARFAADLAQGVLYLRHELDAEDA